MGSLCTTPDESQNLGMPGQQQNSLVVWGDITTTETRTTLTLLNKALIKYEFVHVPRPTDSESL